MVNYNRRRQLNMALSVLPTFTPMNDYEIYHINRATSVMLVPELIALARKTTRFTIDTEHDYYTHRAALIQIEFIQQPISIVLLIETCHLPHTSSVLFWLIRSLLKIIFHSSNTIYSWGDATCELTSFIHYDLFSLHILHQMNTIDVQVHFKQWYNSIYKHTCGLLFSDDDHLLCTCLYRPVKNPHHQWSLQKATAYTFEEFLDKTRTKSRWSRPLDLANDRQHFMINKSEKKLIDQLILYAINDCLAVSKLFMVIESMWTKEQLEQYRTTSINSNLSDENMTNEGKHFSQQIHIQSSSLSNNESVSSALEIDNNENKTFSQQLRETNMIVKLSDCMRCYVRIPRCQIDEQNHCLNTNVIPIELDRQLQELREEQEKTSENQQNEVLRQDDDEEEKEFRKGKHSI